MGEGQSSWAKSGQWQSGSRAAGSRQVIQAFRRPGHGLPIASGQARVALGPFVCGLSDGASTCGFAFLQSRAERRGLEPEGKGIYWGLGRQWREVLINELGVWKDLCKGRGETKSHPTSAVRLAG